MLELVRLIYIDIKRALKSKCFYNTIILINLILFGSAIPYLFYRQIDILFIINKLIQNKIVIQCIFPIAVLSHTFSMKEDIRSCYIQYILIRTKVKYYCLSKVICCIAIGTLIVFIASIIFILLLSIRFPFISVTGTSYEFFYNRGILDNKIKGVYIILYVISKISYIFIGAILLVIIGLICHSYFKYSSLIIFCLWIGILGISNYFRSLEIGIQITNGYLIRSLCEISVMCFLSNLLINIVINRIRRILGVK